MTLPGFGAENSLSTGSCYVGTVTAERAGSAEVIPQFCYTNEGGVLTCCSCYYGYCNCNVIHKHVLM
jgi:hypothetical protein